MKLAIRLPLFALVLAAAGLATVSTHAQEVDFKAGENTWADSKVGDWVEYRVTSGQVIRQEVTGVSEDGVSFLHITRNADGEEVARKEHTRAVEDAPLLGAVPRDMDVEWSEGRYELTDGEMVCQVVSWAREGSTGANWYSSEVPCGGVVQTTSDGEPSVRLVAWHRDGETRRAAVIEEDEPEPEPEPQPEPEPEPEPGPAPAPDHGEPITMSLPDSVRDEMKDQGAAITRMRVYFDDRAENKDGISLEFEGMRTQVPVIYAAFDGDDCDKEISYKEWTRRRGRYVDLAIDVKTAPRRLKGMEVRIVHTHIQGENETELNKFEVSVPEPDESWDSHRLRGALPGINRYTIEVTYTNANGESTTHRGFSHWVIVQAPPMFEFLNAVNATATRAKAGGNTLLKADVAMNGSFILHHGLDPDDCELRITRKGKREMDLSGLPAELRRVIGKERIPPGWQEVARVDMKDGEVDGNRVVTIEDQFVKVDFRHALSASDKVLPLSEQWEYRFELHHDDSTAPLATWTVNVSLRIDRPEDIASARLKIRATGLDEPLEVPFNPGRKSG